MEAWLWHLNDLAELPLYEATHELLESIGIGRANWELLPWSKGPGTNDKNAMRLTMRTVFYQLMSGMEKIPDDLGQYLMEERTQKWVLNLVLKRMDNSSSNPFTELKLRRFSHRISALKSPLQRTKAEPSTASYQSCERPKQLLKFAQSKLQSTLLQTGERARKLQLPALDTLNALKRQDQGLNIGMGRRSYVEIDMIALDEKAPFKINLTINSD